MFYNRGKIEVKGLGLKQTYFIEPPCEDGKTSDVIVVKPDSPSGYSLRVDSSNSQQDQFIRNPSFVRFSKCTIVNTLSTSPPVQPRFDDIPCSEDSSQSLGIQMVKPRSTASVCAEGETRRINQVVPDQTPQLKTEIQITTPEDKETSRPGSASLFVSNGNSNNGNIVSTVEDNTSQRSKQRNKCSIS